MWNHVLLCTHVCNNKHKGESVNRSQKDIKRKICDTRTWGQLFISPHILHQYWYTCLIALPVCQYPQHRSLLTVSATSARPFQLLRHQRNVCQPVVNRFTRQTLSTVNRKHFFMDILCIDTFYPRKTHNRTLFFGSLLLKQGRYSEICSEHAHARLLPRLSWSCTVLLPSDTHREPITSNTAVLLPFVTYLLTLPRVRELTQISIFIIKYEINS
jgi:hypothetical protein